MAGLVFVNQQRVDKPGSMVLVDDKIQIKGADNPYVSRGGLKLEKALKKFAYQLKIEFGWTLEHQPEDLPIAFFTMVQKRYTLSM
jgi:ribosomal protein S4